jgi:hypothetical protein
MLAVGGTNTEEVAKLVMPATESAGRYEASKTADTAYPSLYVQPAWMAVLGPIVLKKSATPFIPEISQIPERINC